MSVVCSACGQEWAHHPALVVACPQCSAPVGAPCKRPSGHRAWGGEPHVEREQLAVDLGLLQKCKAAPGIVRHPDGREEIAQLTLLGLERAS